MPMNSLLNEYAQAKNCHNSAAAKDQTKHSKPIIAKELKRMHEQMSSLLIKQNIDSCFEPTSTQLALLQRKF